MRKNKKNKNPAKKIITAILLGTSLHFTNSIIEKIIPPQTNIYLIYIYDIFSLAIAIIIAMAVNKINLPWHEQVKISLIISSVSTLLVYSFLISLKLNQTLFHITAISYIAVPILLGLMVNK